MAKAENKGGIDKLRQNRAELFRSKMTLPGPEREGGPVSAAEEDYAKRAFPATDIPIALRRNAHAAWASVRGRSGREAANALGAWTLAGPSTSNAPDILTFSGAAYTTSGRITALAVDPSCNTRRCRVWAAAAGGGVWRTTNALAGSRADWTFVSGSFATNAIGTLTYDAATGALYAGTGEPNASGDSEAGFGIYKSTDGGNTWTHLAANTTVPVMATPCGDAPAYTGPAFDGRATSSIVVRGNTMYVGSTRAVRGVSSVTGGGVTLAPGLPPYGLWKSTDGGATFALLAPEGVCLNPALPGDAGKIQASFGSARGVNDVEFDPNYATNTTLYAAAFPRLTASGGGVWRSNDDGANWTQIKTALAPNNINDRAEFAVTLLGSGTTRMYVGDGNTGSPAARFYRSDDVATGSPTFTDLTTTQNEDYCTGQCWYDNVVYSPPGKPDVVYLGGSYSYGSYGFTTNGRAFIRSADAGASFTDMTWDATTNPTPPGSCCQPNPIAPNGQHPDSHAIVEIPGTNSAIFGGDGGLMRSSGAFADISGQCTTYRGLTGTDLALCQQLLSAVPTYLYNLNKGLSTLQFQSLSVAADNPKHLQGGTQDNGTFETTGSAVTWPQIIYGDGGQSGFNVVNSAQRFNTFFANYTDANFQNGAPSKWVVISGPLFAESSLFYKPIIADPTVPGTIFVGLTSVWRTQDWGGNQALLEANCPEFTTPGNQPGCGDFVRIGDGVPSASLTSSAWGDRAGGNVAAVERTPSNTGTLWAATTTGRVFISSNADAAAGSVHYTRLDSLASNDPNRFVSGVYVDPANANHAWICYSSYSSLTPTTPGHVFSVTYDPIGGTATWTNLDGSGPTAFPDFPATDIVHDSNGDLYVSNDWGVLRRANGSSDWVVAGTGLPMVEVAGLTIVPSARVLYAATHGRSAWKLTLP
ncbi:MAG: hypothetical protein AUI05_01710 [Verrucomicrobia bacterium 13_2_20CM_2_54_15_9cls]|nr:MAG: hypothetical protein AUI05_01710 [Verrucomicrobia bacterium 13_2_20CM_2_54_15_9cls]